ncbi:Ammonium transporter NrgA [bacterium HR37]|nr:Ammonium transporter NrgA [bacterium HR37]
MGKKAFITTAICLLLPTYLSFAQEPSIDTGDTAWILTSSALVLMMTIPGLFLFYGGLVRAKNTLGTIMQSFTIVALVSIQWVLFGYSLAFGPDKGGIIGSLEWFALRGVGIEPNPDYASTIPHQAFMVFQMMFAIITPALITGAFAERAKFGTFMLFILLWTTFIYDPIAHWVWGINGWMREMGALDFAGGTVVHISSGVSALAAALIFGKRIGYGKEAMPPHNLPFTIVGASLLWVGWFGFNAGSALASGTLATSAFVVTHVATASAILGWMFTEWIIRRKPTVLGAATGAVAGLVAITPASGFVSPLSAIAIGIGAGILCYAAVNLKVKLGLDDSLDVVGVHGIGGTWGAIATGLFASKAINPAGADGLFFGNPSQLKIQAIAVIATWLFAFFGTLTILFILKAIMGLRVSIEKELEGLDLSEHGEVAYSGFQMIHSLGSSEIKALEEEIEELEKRKEKILMRMVSTGFGEGLIGRSLTKREELEPQGEAVVDKPFKIVVENVSKEEIKRWWEDMCYQSTGSRPKEFNEIFRQVKKFHNGTFFFRRGNPEEAKRKLNLLLRGFNPRLRVEYGED